MTVEMLITQFATLPFADVGCGPRHPTTPRADLVPKLREYLSFYPYLSRYSEYLELIECYAGASIGRENPWMVMLIYGLDNFDDPCANLLRPDGFHVFSLFRATQENRNHLEIGFAFNTNAKNDFNVYRNVTWDRPFEFYESSFLAWLTEVVERQGRMGR